jgi:hypothetical protein
VRVVRQLKRGKFSKNRRRREFVDARHVLTASSRLEGSTDAATAALQELRRAQDCRLSTRKTRCIFLKGLDGGGVVE